MQDKLVYLCLVTSTYYKQSRKSNKSRAQDFGVVANMCSLIMIENSFLRRGTGVTPCSAESTLRHPSRVPAPVECADPLRPNDRDQVALTPARNTSRPPAAPSRHISPAAIANTAVLYYTQAIKPCCKECTRRSA